MSKSKSKSKSAYTLHHFPDRGASGLFGVVRGCTLTGQGAPREDIGVIFVTPTKFSSNPKSYKEIIQTPTSLQLVWFPPKQLSAFITFPN